MEEEIDNVRKALVVVNLNSLCSSHELHSVLKYVLGLPSFYGVLPEDSKIVIKLMNLFNEKHPS